MKRSEMLADNVPGYLSKNLLVSVILQYYRSPHILICSEDLIKLGRQDYVTTGGCYDFHMEIALGKNRNITCIFRTETLKDRK